VVVNEIRPKSILSVSKVYQYVVNPYVGCQFSCSYCYARFMKRFTGHREPWGQFVDVKITAPELLKAEVAKKRRGKVWISGVCDPYQPLEARYKLTRQCLEVLADANWPVVVQTKSPLVVRDIDILQRGKEFEAGFSIGTADDDIRQLFEPGSPAIQDRIAALDELHRTGIRTYVMIAPMLPGAEDLPPLLAGKVDRIILDRMNYRYADWVYRKHGLVDQMTDDFFDRMRDALCTDFGNLGIVC
jgi:DNA repair photolyase